MNQKIKLKGIDEENFRDYKKASLFLAFPQCNYKCCIEQGLDKSICQNSHLHQHPSEEYSFDFIWNLYISNSLTEAFVLGGLDPMETFEDVLSFINFIRNDKKDLSDIVIYTGYYLKEIENKIDKLKQYPNIIVKFGRYTPDKPSRYDEILGVNLVSDNQYAAKIS